MINASKTRPGYIHRLYMTDAIYKGELVISSSGFKPAIAALATQICVGLALEDTIATGICPVLPIGGAVLEIDFTNAGTKKTFADTDLGTLYDFVVTSHDAVLDPDDTSGGSLMLVGYDNVNLKAYVIVPNTLLLVS